MLYRESLLRVPQGDVRNKLVLEYHSNPSTGHLGERKSLNHLLPKYYWKNMRNTVRE